MRFVYIACLVGFVGPARADEKRSEKEQVIKEVKLDRKTPVAYEKEVYGLFADNEPRATRSGPSSAMTTLTREVWGCLESRRTSE